MGNPLGPKTASLLRWLGPFFLAALQAVPLTSSASLPTRLVLLLDGVSYRDVQALQQGTVVKTIRGRQVPLLAFRQGYFPASRLISTFPSISDPAWTEILGNHPGARLSAHLLQCGHRLGGLFQWRYQLGRIRNADDLAHARKPPPGHELWVSCQGFSIRAKRDHQELSFNRRSTRPTSTRSFIPQIAPSICGGDINSMLCALDEKLQELRSVYRAVRERIWRS